MEHKRCLVTGGNGFIGSHLVERLLDMGHSVITIDDFLTRSSARLMELSHKGELDICCGNIQHFEQICSFFRDVDWVFHTAARAVMSDSLCNPMEYYRTNVLGTCNVVESARLFGVKKFVYLASGSCYGDPEIVPTPETTSIKPMNPYALTKYLGEQYALSMGRIYNMSVVSLRMYYVFGCGTRPGTVFNLFAKQRSLGDPITIAGEGEQQTDFIHVDDVINAILMAVKSDIYNEIFNVGSGESHSLHEVINLLGCEHRHIASRVNDPEIVRSDISKIYAKIGWRPYKSFVDGVQDTFELD